MQSIQEGIGSFSLTICDENANAGYIESKIMEVSLFDDNKIVIIKHFPLFAKSSATDNKRIIELLSNIPQNCYVVIDGISPKKRSKIYKAVEKIGKVYDFPEYLKQKEAITWLANRFQLQNKSIELSDVKLIVDSIGANESGISVDRLYSCLQKICDYTGSSKKVSREDIIKSADRYNHFIIWSLFDSLDKRNFEECVKTIHCSCQTHGVTETANQVFNMLLWRFRMLWFLKENNARKKSDNDILQDAQDNLKKLSRSGSGTSVRYCINEENKPMYSQNVMRNALRGFYNNKPAINAYKRNEIFRAIQCAEQCLLLIRHGATDMDIISLFDNFFFTMMPQSISHDDLDHYRRIIIEPT